MDETNWPLMVAVVSVSFGGFGAFAISQLVHLCKLRQRGVKVRGQVTDVIRGEEINRREGRKFHYSVKIGYQVDGTDYTHTLPLNANPALFEKGEAVAVYYPPGKPAAGRVVMGRTVLLWGLAAITSLGVVVIVCVLAYYQPSG